MRDILIKDFNVIYKDQLYKNCVNLLLNVGLDEDRKPIIKEIEIIYVDENGFLKIVRDNEDMFKFVRK